MAEVIDSRFVDVDLAYPPDDMGSGLLEYDTEDELMAAEVGIPNFGEEFPQFMVPRDKLQEIAEATSLKYRATTRQIYSQGRTSACVGFAAAQALETTLVRRYGAAHYVQLAGMDVYSWIGNTLMSGAYVPDGMKRLTVGCLPLDTPENRDRYDVVRGGLDYTKRRSPPGAAAVHQLFRVTRWAKAQGRDEINSVLASGFVGTVGRSRHSIPYLRLVYSGGNFMAGYGNSWSPDWGDEGWGYDSERAYRDLTMYVVLDVASRPDLQLPVAP